MMAGFFSSDGGFMFVRCFAAGRVTSEQSFEFDETRGARDADKNWERSLIVTFCREGFQKPLAYVNR